MLGRLVTGLLLATGATGQVTVQFPSVFYEQAAQREPTLEEIAEWEAKKRAQLTEYATRGKYARMNVSNSAHANYYAEWASLAIRSFSQMHAHIGELKQTYPTVIYRYKPEIEEITQEGFLMNIFQQIIHQEYGQIENLVKPRDGFVSIQNHYFDTLTTPLPELKEIARRIKEITLRTKDFSHNIQYAHKGGLALYQEIVADVLEEEDIGPLKTRISKKAKEIQTEAFRVEEMFEKLEIPVVREDDIIAILPDNLFEAYKKGIFNRDYSVDGLYPNSEDILFFQRFYPEAVRRYLEMHPGDKVTAQKE